VDPLIETEKNRDSCGWTLLCIIDLVENFVKLVWRGRVFGFCSQAALLPPIHLGFGLGRTTKSPSMPPLGGPWETPPSKPFTGKLTSMPS
jgi:hypothetical protein